MAAWTGAGLKLKWDYSEAVKRAEAAMQRCVTEVSVKWWFSAGSESREATAVFPRVINDEVSNARQEQPLPNTPSIHSSCLHDGKSAELHPQSK